MVRALIFINLNKIKLVRDLFVIFLITLLLGCSQNSTTFKLQKGDLLFQDLDCGELCDAIEKVTTGIDGKKFSHVAIISKIDNDGKAYVIEAYDGVTEIPINEFLKRSRDEKGRPKVVVGRLLPEYQYMIPVAVSKAYKLIGKKYDSGFDLKNDSYYCSELIYEIFKYDDKGRPVELFPLNAMTFKDPGTGKIMSVWSKYFKKLGMPVPEGQPGINPGAISVSPKVRVFDFPAL
jgi:hypothetical protein